MNYSLIKIPLFTLVVVLVSLTLVSCNLNKASLVKKLNSQIREEKFSELYDQSADIVSLNVTKEQFVNRMKILVRKLKSVDETLNFQDSPEWESNFSNSPDDQIIMRAFQTLGKDGKEVLIAYYWDSEGKFWDLWVNPINGTSQEYDVPGVICKECLNTER
jgi:hypothetical protein